MTGHAYFPPSGAPIWAHCSAFPFVNASSPNIDTEATLEGNAAHWVVAEVLVAAGKHAALDVEAVLSMHVGRQAPNGTVIDEDITDSAGVMVDDVLETCREYSIHPSSLQVEYRVQVPTIHPTKCWGTLDASLSMPGRVILWDFKHGHGKVDAKGNRQLVAYAEGLRLEMDVDGHAAQLVNLEFRIVQPRCYQRQGSVDVHVQTFADIRGEANVLASQAREAEENPQMCAGPHCRYCPAVVRCEASREHNYHLIDRVRVPLFIDSMTGEDLAVERQILLDGMVTLKSRLEDIEEELRGRVRGGDSTTGLALEAEYGRKGWAVPAAQVVAFGAGFGVDLAKEGVITPAQAVKKAPKALRPHFEEALKAITKREPKGLALIQASGTRTARAFKKEQEQTPCQ